MPDDIYRVLSRIFDFSIILKSVLPFISAESFALTSLGSIRYEDFHLWNGSSKACCQFEIFAIEAAEIQHK